ncbi:MAG: hypothetical protein DRN81_04730 [Thermoproteota archaeon]|nr:MAG: hypothetical protein DRN81_04730 [Candidatus Korarchaeota archaeon]
MVKGARVGSLLPKHKKLVEYIAKEYWWTNKIAEIGVGFYPFPSCLLKQLTKKQIIVVDNNMEALRYALKHCPDLVAVYDNIMKPNLQVYCDVDLLYSIRPNEELIPYIEDLASKIKADLIISPMEYTGLLRGWKKVRLGEYLFHVRLFSNDPSSSFSF